MRCSRGDLAIIEESTDGISVGKIVQCVSVEPESHYKYGPVWNVRCKDKLMTEYGGYGHTVQVPDAWLRPIKPPSLKTKTDQKELVE